MEVRTIIKTLSSLSCLSVLRFRFLHEVTNLIPNIIGDHILYQYSSVFIYVFPKRRLDIFLNGFISAQVA